MMRIITQPLAAVILLATASCLPLDSSFALPEVETQLAFFNFSKTRYACLAVRVHSEDDPQAFRYTPLLPPGGVYRDDWSAVVGESTPDAVDLRVFVYRRINEDIPIGLDDNETVHATPEVAGEITAVPVIGVQKLETYTIANWEAPEGSARVKLVQCSTLDQQMQETGFFDNAEGVWDIEGVAAELAGTAPPARSAMAPVTGSVVLEDKSPLANVGILLRGRWRTSLDCSNPNRESDAGYGPPLAIDVTDEQGRFQINRPAGVYEIECFSDDYAFRPAIMRVETPLRSITILAEPLADGME